jgi:hypothetical protein
MDPGNALQAGTCAKCGRQAQGKTYNFYYGTEGGQVLGSSAAFVCSSCVVKEGNRTGVILLVGGVIIAVLGVVILKLFTSFAWLAWVLCFPLAAILILAAIGYFSSPGKEMSGEGLAIEAKTTDITQQYEEVNKFWRSSDGEKAAKRMKEATIETCAKCKKEAIGQRYQFYYGCMIDQKTNTTDVIIANVRTTRTLYRIGGTGTAFICDRCAGHKPEGSTNKGEKAAIDVSREEYLRQHGSTTLFWTTKEYARLE